ncbi:PREDICTED: trophoblast glycoprotein [Bison bison bison]|uniref:Trophoblast glycoprotein n=1 Tax=Bison bison bison TaxID=43346 RepID=A0A6P3J101_BISBB|nr:PREDICTED: trophoblast glycoprotein [Bison bison bison]
MTDTCRFDQLLSAGSRGEPSEKARRAENGEDLGVGEECKAVWRSKVKCIQAWGIEDIWPDTDQNTARSNGTQDEHGVCVMTANTNDIIIFKNQVKKQKYTEATHWLSSLHKFRNYPRSAGGGTGGDGLITPKSEVGSLKHQLAGEPFRNSLAGSWAFSCCRCTFAAHFPTLLLCYASIYLVTALSAQIRANFTRCTSGFVPVQAAEVGPGAGVRGVGARSAERTSKDSCNLKLPLRPNLDVEERSGRGRRPRKAGRPRRRSRSGSCGRRQQKRREVPPGGGGRKTSGRRSAEPSVPTGRAYFLEGRGGGLGPGGGRPVARGLAKFRRRRWRRPSSAPTRGKFSPEASGRPAPSGAPSPEPSERAASQPGSGDTRAAMPGGCSRGPAAGDGLHLEDNALKVLRNGTLAELQSLPHFRVFLDDNPWVCDCHMVDMVAWLKETEVVQGKGRLTCAFPEKMRHRVLLELNSSDLDCDPILPPSLQTSYVFLGIVLALIGAIFLLVLYLNRKGIKKWMHNIRDACRDHMEGYHYRYEINADPRLTNLSSNSDV